MDLVAVHVSGYANSTHHTAHSTAHSSEELQEVYPSIQGYPWACRGQSKGIQVFRVLGSVGGQGSTDEGPLEDRKYKKEGAKF